MNGINMLDLAAEYELFRSEVRAVVDQTFDSQRFIGGPAVAELEDAVCERFGFGNAIAVSNGTDALLCALMALGIGHGDEVIVPAFTFFATGGCVARLGATPVFAEIDPRTFNIEPASVEALVTPRTKAIVPVHVFGQCADMDSINAIAAKHELDVVEDAAQAIGAKYNGRFAGKLGRIASLSFYPTKNLGGFGEGGMIMTDDDDLGQIVRQLRNHGESKRYHHERVGGNFRLDTLKAAILHVKLKWLDEFTSRRQANAERYDRLLADAGVALPVRCADCTHVFHQYSILCDDRDALIAFLRERQIGAGIYYPLGLHRQPCFEQLGAAESLPVTDSVCSRVLSLPCHPMLSTEDVERVAAAVTQFVESGCSATGAGGLVS